MDRYALATAVTGDTHQPQFHCNVIKLDGDSVKPISAERQVEIDNESTKQIRLISDVKFEHLKQLSFSAPIDTDNLQETARRFLAVIKDVVKLQDAKDDSANTQVPIMIGQDGRRGFNYYERNYIYKAFVREIKKDKKLDIGFLNKIQFHFGHFNVKGGDKISDSKSIHDDEELVATLKESLSDDVSRDIALSIFKRLASDKAQRIAQIAPMKYNYLLRFTKFCKPGSLRANPDFAFLGFDKEIEREFVDTYQKAISLRYKAKYGKEIPVSHFAPVFEDNETQYFAEVMKTVLLDQVSETEDGIDRNNRSKDRAMKAMLGKDLAS